MKFNLANIFTFLKENKILVVVKTKLLDVLEEHKNIFKEKVKVAIDVKTPLIQVAFVDFVMKNIRLPFYLKPFKPLVRRTINKNFDKIVDFIKEQIDKV